jgi:hypothetical protein
MTDRGVLQATRAVLLSSRSVFGILSCRKMLLGTASPAALWEMIPFTLLSVTLAVYGWFCLIAPVRARKARR